MQDNFTVYLSCIQYNFMEELISYQDNLLRQVSNSWFRYLYHELKTKERLLGIKGLRGTGKTTLLLQYLTFGYPDKKNALYVTVDHPYFYQNTLFDLASEWYKYGGKLLLVDEVHKYKNWSRELKLIYDGHPGLQVFFTSSSALDLYRGESDLSRRLAVQNLHGMSFREYLSLRHQEHFGAIGLKDILNNHQKIAGKITTRVKILPLFNAYLKEGYFPFISEIDTSGLQQRLLQIINTVLETDLAFSQDYSASNVHKIKKLLGVIAATVPFEPNISKIAEKLQLGRTTVYNYLNHLRDAHILNLANKPDKGINFLQKPDKIYFENTAFAHAFQENPKAGTLRETFFMNQIQNAGHRIYLDKKADFQVDEKWIFEIGGRNKSYEQIKGFSDAYIAADGIETGFGSKVPLWLFGFLY